MAKPWNNLAMVKPRLNKPARDVNSGRELIDLIDNEIDSRLRKSVVHELNIGIVLWPEFPLLSLAGLIDVLRHAADHADNSRKLRCSWTIMGGPNRGAAVVSSCGVEIRADDLFLDPRQFNYIAVIGGLLRSTGRARPESRAYLQHVANSGVPLMGICTGTFVLASAGLLDGRRVCLHPYHVQEFKKMFPQVHSITNVDYVDDGDRLSCAGGISVISLATHLVAQHCGQDRATKAVHQMTVPNRTDTSQVAVSQAIGYTRVADPRVRRAVFLIEQGLLRAMSPDWIAKQVGVSGRQLARLFQAEFGLSPAAYLRQARLRYAKWLLQNSQETITEVALRTGFCDCSHFVRQFHQEFGLAPGKFRERARPSA
jgi:transcriptional regulator GlxA family with amidase domain